MRVLVIGGLNQCSVAAVRALAKAGHEVDAAVTLARGRLRAQLWFASRRARRKTVVPHPREDPEAFGESVLALCRGARHDAVLPIGEESTLVLAGWQTRLAPHAASPLADAARIALVHDKQRLHRELQAAGFMLPRRFEYACLDDLASMEIAFPVVVKARRNSGVRRGLRHAHDRDSLLAAVDEIEAHPSPHPEICDYSKPVVEEFIPGATHDVDCLYRLGEPRAAMTSLRAVTLPASGGIGVTTLTTHEPELAAYCESILRHLRWHGLCNFEAKRDSRDGRFKLIEINPRAWGLLDMNAKAGIDFATMACEMAARGDTAAVAEYAEGFRYTMLLPRTVLSVVEREPGRWRRLAQAMQFLEPGGRCEIDLRDPLPHVYDALNTGRILWARLRGHG